MELPLSLQREKNEAVLFAYLLISFALFKYLFNQSSISGLHLAAMCFSF
jgi:hypothetical protein